MREVLITGGAGFIGANWAARLLAAGDARVHIFDNLARAGVHQNLAWLKEEFGDSDRLAVTIADIRDAAAVNAAVRGADEIYHFAAQTAVTASVADPVHDFEINVRGTINVLEAARLNGNHPFLLFTSTNKVYGELTAELRQEETRYRFADRSGIDESQPLDFHSPYGCSKGAADQYVRDYARIYGLPTVVLRMSCIAGPHQHGNEDQGWVAHFMYATLERRPISIYGDGKQVRDVLHVADLLDAFERLRNTRASYGEVFNIGAGEDGSASLLEVMDQIEDLTGHRLEHSREPFRPGDQRVYVTDHAKLTRLTGWQPRRGLRETLLDIADWWQQRRLSSGVAAKAGPAIGFNQAA